MEAETYTHAGQSPALTDWKNEPKVMDLQEDLAMAKPSHDLHVSRVRHWLSVRDAKRAKETKENKTNRSKMQPKLVRRQNEWRYAALSEPFLSSPDNFTVAPVSFEDGKGAEQNAAVLNWQFRTKLSMVKFIDSYVRATVDEGTSFVRVGWNRQTTKVKEEVGVWTYYGVTTPEQMQMLEHAMQIKAENPQGYEELPEGLRKSAEYSMETKQPAWAEQTGTTLVEVEKVVKNHPTLEVVHFENIFLDPNCEDDVDKAGFYIISFITSKGELQTDGRYKNLDHVNWNSAGPLNNADHVTASMDQAAQYKDTLRKKVVAYEYWGFRDVNGTGQLTPIVATWIGTTMVRMEENPFPDQKLNLVVVPYMPVLRSLMGEPDAELLEDNQAILGAVTRGMIDLMAKSANGQTGFAKGFLDIPNRARYDRGQDYEFNPVGAGPDAAIHQHKYPEIPGSALTMLQLQNQEAEALTGVKAFSGGMSGDGFGEVAAGIRGMLDAASKREMSILRRLREGFESIGRKILMMNQEFLSEEEVIQVTNKEFVKVLRSDLAGEYNLKVDIATPEIDEAKSQDLGFMLQTLGNTVPFDITQTILVQIAKLKRMPELAHTLENYQQQPDPVAEKMRELEIAKLDAEIRRINSQSMLDEAKIQTEMADARAITAKARNIDLNTIEQESGTKHLRDLDKQGEQGRANQKLEVTKRLLAQDEPGKSPKRDDVSAAIGYEQMSNELTSS
jgi:hypothetical protein